MQYLSDRVNGRDNNLDVMRFILATWVLFVHSYPLSGSSFTGDKLRVMAFFIISGFFITISLTKNSNVWNFLKARVLRIFPGLIFVTIVTVFLIGFITTDLSVKEYFSNSETLNYFKVLLIKSLDLYTLPGVFENNIYSNQVNGSIWTIYFEVIFYIGIAILGLFKLVNKWIMLLLFTFAYLVFLSPITFMGRYFEMFIFFSVGSLFYLYRNKIPLKVSYAIVSLLLLLVASYFGYFVHAFAFFGTYLVLFLIFYRKISIPFSANMGNYSYGLFLFGFPVQQAIVHFLGGSMNPIINFIIAFPIALSFAMISWHLVESHFIKYKYSPLFKTDKKLIKKEQVV